MQYNDFLSEEDLPLFFPGQYAKIPTLLSGITKNGKKYYSITELNQLIVSKKIPYNFSRIHEQDTCSEFCSTRKIKNNNLNVIDLFCGAGGSSAGFRLAGFNLVGALDINAPAAATHSLNFRKCKTIVGDISQLSAKDFHSQIGNPRVDIVIGSPPCQTFSSLSQGKIKSLGKDIKLDNRNYFYKYYLDYVKYFSPKAFLMENVPGFQTRFQGAIFKDLLNIIATELTEYDVKYTVLEADKFSVPQSRKRFFLCAFKRGINFDFPQGSTKFCSSGQSIVSVEEAIQDLPYIEDNWRLDHGYYSLPISYPYQKIMRAGTDIVCNNICRVSNEKAKEMFSFLSPGQRYDELSDDVKRKISLFDSFKSSVIMSRCHRLPLKDVSWTVIAHIGMDGYEYIHPTQARTLSVREAARIQSFPDDFIFVGNMREQYMQIGNAVPPLLSYAIATQIAKKIQEWKKNNN